jgi:hypothetical protein
MQKEQRQDQRRAIAALPVTVSQRRANRLSAHSIPGEIRDVSTSGARIRLMATADLAADVPIEMLCFMAEHPDSGVQETTLVRLDAWIVWSDRVGREIGVRFMA